jgi:uncharacterized protein YfaS (alpha-2-macroglobulin family)
MHKTFQKGECCQAYLVNLDHDDDPVDASTVTILISDPDGSVLVNNSAMTKKTTGEYEYNYDIPSNATVGKYEVAVTVTTSGHINKVYSTFGVK